MSANATLAGVVQVFASQHNQLNLFGTVLEFFRASTTGLKLGQVPTVLLAAGITLQKINFHFCQKKKNLDNNENI